LQDADEHEPRLKTCVAAPLDVEAVVEPLVVTAVDVLVDRLFTVGNPLP
jgi:hypothetical protein